MALRPEGTGGTLSARSKAGGQEEAQEERPRKTAALSRTETPRAGAAWHKPESTPFGSNTSQSTYKNEKQQPQPRTRSDREPPTVGNLEEARQWRCREWNSPTDVGCATQGRKPPPTVGAKAVTTPNPEILLEYATQPLPIHHDTTKPFTASPTVAAAKHGRD